MKKLKWLTSKLAAVNKFVGSETLRGWVIVGLTACVVGTNIVVCRLMNKQISINREQVNDLKRFARTENRAYIILDRFDKPTGIKDGEILVVTPRIINCGKTPAHNGWSSSAVIVNETGFPAEPINDVPQDSNTWIWGPNQSHNVVINQPIKITQEMVDGINSGQLKIFVYVYTRYTDVFDDPHETAIYSWYNVRDNTFVSARKYNYAN